MIANIAKVTITSLPYGAASARLGYCVLNNKECSDSEFFAADMMFAEKIQNLNFFAGANEHAQLERLGDNFLSPVPRGTKIQNLNFSSPSLPQGKNSDSEFSCEAEQPSDAKAAVSYADYWRSVRTMMRELKM